MKILNPTASLPNSLAANSLIISFNLTEIAQAPAFLENLSNVEVDENQPTKLEAKVDGQPLPRVEWSKDGALVKEGPNVTVIIS